MVTDSFTYRARRFWWAYFSRGNLLTTLILGSNIACFIAQLVWLYSFHSPWFDDTFALSLSGIKAGHAWQLLTYGWLHSETLFIHILFNMMMVRYLGRQLEWPLGPFRFALLYLGSILAAAGVWLLFGNPSLNDGIEGASGAVFGLLAAYACHDPRRVIRVWILFIIPLRMQVRSLAILLIAIELICQLGGWWKEIGHLAHLGGAAFGYLLMRLWHRKQPPVQPIVFEDSFSNRSQNL